MIGPELPPHLQRPKAQNDESDDEDDYMPELPPDLKPSTSQSVTHSTPSSSKPAPPARKPSPAAPARLSHSYDEDESDDDVGPQPLRAPPVQHDENEGIRRFMEVERRRREEAENAAKPQAPKREEWMLVPPSASELLSNIDPTKKRTFSSSTVPKGNGKNEPNLWTETPQERLQRLKDEVDGRRKRAVNPTPDEDDGNDRNKRRKVEEDYQRNIGASVEEHTKKIRGPSLTDAHLQREKEKARAKSKEEEEPEAIWDRERDLGVGGRIFSDGERRKALKDARSGLGDRFGSGTTGRFM
ncbi:hypothetical protein BD626DRAFT_44296 [Schizophyllum amplum]|uniref:DUF3752 domain-containing protein n=1 Tax=Schizophyllum amplum TaxID=97359 RepID=A0A550CDW4_9AGAR|nr:hypothetical protein BD626DRAFT_44296 [Auriculariopsis ampla]